MKAQTFFYALPVAACILCSAVAAENGVTANPNKAGDGVQVGVGGRDGVTVSGGEAYVTRNGATEKMLKELILPSGVIAQTDGTILLRDGTQATLKSSQLLTFEGKVIELPPDPNVNPGARAAAIPNTNAATSAPMPTNAAAGTGMSSGRHFDRNEGGGVFVNGSGIPFMGTLAADGSIVTSDGRTIPFDSTIRAVTFSRNGTPALGTVNANGSITQADGTILFADGSVRTADGTVINAPRDARGNPIRSAIPQNTTNQPLTNANGQPASTNAQPANQNVPATNNNATGSTTTAPNRKSGTSQATGSGARPSGARNGGSSGGAGTGTGASGAGGASGGGGGGATR